MRILRPLPFVLMFLLVASVCRAERFYPMIMAVRPVAVQTGKTCECEFESVHNMHGAYKVFVTGTGVTGEVDPASPSKPVARAAVTRLKVRFKTDADALPGMRDVRLI